jgi:excisionase family DNA binding protein
MRRYLVNTAELAGVLGVSRWTVNRMVRDKRLPFEPVPGLGVNHFRRSDVETYVGAPIDLDDLEAAS